MPRAASAPLASTRHDVGPALVLLLVAALVGLGLTILASAAEGTEGTRFLQRQVIWLAIGLMAGFVAWRFPLDWLEKLAWPIGVVSLALLAIVLVPGIGIEINGARRWLGIGPLRLQPSDPARLGLIVLLAAYLARNQRGLLRPISGFLAPVLVIGAFAGLTFLEPDYGTAFLLAAVGFAMLFLSGSPLLYLAPTMLLGALGFAAAVALDPVRFARIASFLDVEASRSEGGYQLWQSLIAFGSGGIEGVGLGQGRQQLSYLPEAHTDFIFPVIGEELGFVATLAVVAMFGTLFVVVAGNLHRARNLFQYLLVWGALLFVSLQALINMGVVTGLLPTKGMSLPFISYGGSNLVTLSVMVGLMLNALGAWQRPVEVRAREL